MDDASPSLRLHPWHERPGQAHHGGEIDLDDTVPDFVVDHIDRLRGVDAGVVHQNVDRAKGPERLGREQVGLLTAGKVGDDGTHLGTGDAFGDFSDGGLQFVLVPAADHHLGSSFDKTPRNRLAEALAASSDDGTASPQVEQITLHTP